MSIRRHHSPDNKQFVNIILTQRTSLLIVQIAGCEARHSFFRFIRKKTETAAEPLSLS